MSEQASWLDANFIQRLQGRTSQPGVIRLDMGREVMSRLAQMAEQHALLQALGQRWQSSLMAQSEQVPIVYARPAVNEPLSMNTAVSKQRHQPQTAKPIVIPNKRTPAHAKPTAKVGKRPLAQPNQPENKAVVSPQPQTTKPILEANKTAAAHPPDKTLSTNHLPMPKSDAVTAVLQRHKQPLVSQPETKVLQDKTAHPELVEKVVSQKQKQQPVSTLADNQPKAKALQGKTARPELVEGAVSSNNPQPSPSIGDTPLPLATSPTQSATVATVTTEPMPTLKAQPRAVVQGQKVTSRKEKAISNAPSLPQSTLVLATRASKKTEPIGKTEPPIIVSGQQSQPHAAAALSVVKPQPLAPKRTAAKPALPAVKSAVGNRIVSGSRPLGNNFTTPLPVVSPFHASPKREAAQMPLSTKPASGAAATPTVTSQPTMSAASNVIQRQVDEAVSGGETAVSPAVNINEIVEEVQRQFMRQLAIEGERRGVALC